MDRVGRVVWIGLVGVSGMKLEEVVGVKVGLGMGLKARVVVRVGRLGLVGSKWEWASVSRSWFE